ncbi:MAG: hypothetical protein H0T79_14990, partial [Deltaproteobacteria bacterium]|nr:hypothetical protein [Deltaproteobacteria bacterium]
MSSTRELRPTEGARFLLERSGPDDGGPRATYACVIATPDAEYAATATLADDGTAVVSGLSPEAPEELRAMLEMFGK